MKTTPRWFGSFRVIRVAGSYTQAPGVPAEWRKDADLLVKQRLAPIHNLLGGDIIIRSVPLQAQLPGSKSLLTSPSSRESGRVPALLPRGPPVGVGEGGGRKGGRKWLFGLGTPLTAWSGFASRPSSPRPEPLEAGPAYLLFQEWFQQL